MFKKLLLLLGLIASPVAAQTTIHYPGMETNNTYSGNNTFNGAVTLNGTVSGLTYSTLPAMSGSCTITGSGVITCTNGTITGQSNGVIPLATASNAITAQSHLDDGVTTANTITSSRNFAVPNGTIVAQTGFGFGYAKQYQSGGGNNGITNCFLSLTECVADPTYGLTEYYSATASTAHSISMAPSNAMLYDYRSGLFQSTCHDPATALFDGNNTCNSFVLYSTNNSGTNAFGRQIAVRIPGYHLQPGADYGSAPVGPTNWTVGKGLEIDQGYASPGIHQELSVIGVKSGVGDNGGLQIYHGSYGGSPLVAADEGDHPISYHGDEANVTTQGTVSSGGGGSGATTVKITCTSDCSFSPNGTWQQGGPGDGRMFIDKQYTADSGYITGCATGTYSAYSCGLDHSVTPSNAIGQISSTNCNAGSAPTPVGTGYNSVTCTVTLTSGGFVNSAQSASITAWSITSNVATFTASNNLAPGSAVTLSGFGTSTFFNGVSAYVLSTGLSSAQFEVNFTHANGSSTETGSAAYALPACFSGGFHEQALITNVTGSGPYTLSMNLRHAHGTGTYIMQGGPCGTFLDITGNDEVVGSTTLRYPLDIIGAHDATHYDVATFNYGADQILATGLGNLYTQTLAVTNIVNTGGIVTIPCSFCNTNNEQFFSGVPIYIFNSSVSAYNGQCTNPQYWPNIASLTCTQAASIGAGTASTASVTLGESQNGHSAYTTNFGAEVLDVLDHTVSPPLVYNPATGLNTFTLEPNGGLWANSDSVEESHHYDIKIGALYTDSIYNPYATATNYQSLTVGGAGNCCGNLLAPWNGTTYWMFSNTQPLSYYSDHGGYKLPPGGITFGTNGTGSNVWQWAINMINAPDPIGSNAFYVGCPASGCTDPTYYYNMFANQTTSGGSAIGLRVTPAQSEYELFGNIIFGTPNFAQTTFSDYISFAPVTIPTLSTPTTTTSGGTLTDSTAYFYKVYAVNFSGSGAVSGEGTVTTGNSGSNINSITLKWTRSQGAVQYVVCRGTTTGSETKGIVLNGVDATTWVDRGTQAFSGSCPTTDATRGGPDQAGWLGVNSSGTAFEAKITAPASAAATYTVNLPATATTGTVVDMATSTSTNGAIPTFANTTGRLQNTSFIPVIVSNSITPAAATTGQCAEQTFTFSGIVINHAVLVNPPALVGAHVWIGGYRVAGSNSVGITFCADATGGTPVSGTYTAQQF